MPRTRNNWSKPPIFVLHRSCQICNGSIRYKADAGGGRWIGGCLKPRCIKLVDIDAKAAMHKRFVPRQDVADDPLWALFGITPECLLGWLGPAPTNWTVLRSSGTREPGWRLDTDYHPLYAWDIACGAEGKWHIPAAGPAPEKAAKGATLEDLKNSLEPVHHHVVDAFEARLNAMYAAEAADHNARAAFANPPPPAPSPFAYLAARGMLPSDRPLGTYAVLPVAKPVTHSFCGAPYCAGKVTGIIQCYSWEIHSCAAHMEAAILSSKAFMHDRGKVVALKDLFEEESVLGDRLATDAENHHATAGFAVLGDDDVWRVAMRSGGGVYELLPLDKLLGGVGVETGALLGSLDAGVYLAASGAHDAFVRLNRISLADVLADPLFEALKDAGGVAVTRSSGAVEKGWTVATEDPNYDGEPMLLCRNGETGPWCLLLLSPDGDVWKPWPVVWLKKVLPETQHVLVDAFIARLDGLAGTK